MMDDQAHARRSDPDTSHEAAAAVTPDLRELQRRVESYARRMGAGGFTDAQMAADLDDTGSTLRTRRSELAARNIVLDSGQRRRFGDSPRRRIVWVHRDFVPGAPPICEPPRVLSKEERQKGREHEIKLRNGADQMAREGRTAFADALREAADFLRTMA